MELSPDDNSLYESLDTEVLGDAFALATEASAEQRARAGSLLGTISVHVEKRTRSTIALWIQLLKDEDVLVRDHAESALDDAVDTGKLTDNTAAWIRELAELLEN